MRPVARIAQSVEQGIENPRVLGSIPSPGTTILKNPPTRRVFAFVLSKIFDRTDSPTNLPTSSQFIRDFLPGLLCHFIRPLSRFVDLFYRGVTA